MSKNKFATMLKSKILKNSLAYLTEKQGKKGKEIRYACLEMEEYLQPINNNLSIEQKRDLFAVKNRMIDIPYNFPKSEKQTLCVCGENEDMQHIYNCEILNKEKQEKLPYEKIYNGNLKQQIDIFKIIKQNLEHREIMIAEMNEFKPPCDHARSAVFQ